MMKKSNSILEGNPWKGLIIFALPIAFSSLLQQLFNATDQVVVGRFAGSLALAAVGANAPVVNLLVNVFSATSIGSNALIARRIGEGNRKNINEVVHTSIAFALTAGFLLTIIGQFVARPLLLLIGTPDNILDMAVLYLRIYTLAFPFALLYNFGAAILRSVGDTKRPMLVLSAAGIINVILNLILVIVFHLGVAGVAIATATANIISSLVILTILIDEESDLKLTLSRLKINIEPLKQILQIGGPAAIQSAVFSIANVSLQSGVNSLGADAVAGAAIVSNFEVVSFFIMNSFSQAVITFCGQNYGAGQKERCKKILRIALLESLVFACIFDMICYQRQNSLLRIFTDVEAVITYGKIKMLIVVAPHFIISFYEIVASGLRSMGHSLGPALMTIIGSVCFRLWWLFFIFPVKPSMERLMFVYPFSWIFTAGLMFTYYIMKRKQLYYC